MHHGVAVRADADVAHGDPDLALHDLVRYQKEVVATGQPVPEHEGAAGAAAPLHPTEYDGKA